MIVIVSGAMSVVCSEGIRRKQCGGSVSPVRLGGYCLCLLTSVFPVLGQPYATTQATGPTTTTNTVLNGMVTPRGLTTAAWFEWGEDENYGQVTEPVAVGNGQKVVRVSVPLGNLFPNTMYRCRLVCSNSAGIAYGWEHRFTTGRRVVSWGEPFGIWGSTLPPVNLGDVIGVAAGDYHGLALKPDGTVTAWGWLGLVVTPAWTPAGLSNIIAVAGGRDHSLGIRSDGKVVAWGGTSAGQTKTNVPSNLTNVVAIAAGDDYSLALKADGTLAGWGISVPPGLINVVAISGGDLHCLALRNNGTVASWGSFPAPVTVPAGLSNVVGIAAGYLHSLALKSDGTVVGWGSGTGTNIPSGLSNVVQIAAGDYSGLGLRSDGSVVAWGTSASFGGISPPPGLTNVVALACGDEFSMALAANTPPQAVLRTLTGPVNLDSVLSLVGSIRDPNGDALTLRVLSLPPSGTLYQFDAGQRGAAINLSNPAVNDTLGRVIFAPGLDEFGAPYTSFDIVGNDAEFDSPPSTVKINIVPPPALTIAPVQASNLLTLSFAGLSNAAYSVWASTNLINWSRQGQASQPTASQFLYNIPVANQAVQFFKVRSP